MSTIGEQRVLNYALQPMSKDAFIELVTADQPDAPAYFTYDAVLNSRERPTLDQALARELKPLTLEQLLARGANGAQLLDTRDPSEFAAAHLAGSINIGLGGQYADMGGHVARPVTPDRDRCGSGGGDAVGAASRAHRVRSRRGISRWRVGGGTRT